MAEFKLTEKRFTLAHVGIAVIIGIAAWAAILAIIQYVKALTGTTSPIKVRGGAMMFRSTPNNKFTTVVSPDGYCISLGSLNQTLVLAYFKSGNDSAMYDDYAALSMGSQVDFFGHNWDQINDQGHHGGKHGANEIRVSIENSCGGVSGLSARLTPEGKSNFYDYAINQQLDDQSYSLRFRDRNCSNHPPVFNHPPKSQDGDADYCEHPASIYVHSGVSDPGDSGSSWHDCKDGECRIEFQVSGP
jgi:hypothetical protein